MIVRKATEIDLDVVEKLYDEIHTAEEENIQQVGWIRGIYPVRTTAESALKNDELFVLENDEKICGAGIINNVQVDSYRYGNWKHRFIEITHTLAVEHRYGKERSTDFISCVTFGKNAEFAEKYLKKGMRIAISGRIQTGSYSDESYDRLESTFKCINAVELHKIVKQT